MQQYEAGIECVFLPTLYRVQNYCTYDMIAAAWKILKPKRHDNERVLTPYEYVLASESVMMKRGQSDDGFQTCRLLILVSCDTCDTCDTSGSESLRPMNEPDGR